MMKKEHEPRTGVGTPDRHAEAAGAALGGDTGDVGTPRDTLEHDPGGTGGSHESPAGNSDPVTRRRHHAA